MATPQLNPLTGIPMTEQQKKEAKVAAIKSTMGGITKAKQAEAEQLAKVAPQLQEAYGKQAGATKLGIQSQLAQQLAQQEGMGAGYNKAAARQQAAQAGLSTGMALGQIGVQSTKEVAGAEQMAQQAKTEAAGQLYEQLTGEQKLEKEVQEGEKLAKVNLTNAMDEAINSTKGGGNDDEELAVQNLMNKYEELKTDFDNNPQKKKELLQKLAGIYKDAIDEDWDDLDSKTKQFLTTNGFTKADWDEAEELDY